MNVTVIIPHYNLGAHLEQAVASVFASNYDKFEVIVLDDGSTEPASLDALAACEARWGRDKRWRCIRQENMGLSATRNRGCQEARGEAILPVDADNMIRPDYLSKAVRCLQQNPKAGVVYAWAKRFGIVDNVWEFKPLDRRAMLLANGVEACSMFRKEAWQSVGGYDEVNFREGYEDWDFWLGLIEKGWEFHLIPEVLFDYQVRSNSMVSKCNDPIVRRKLISALIDRHWGLYAKEWPVLLVDRDVSMLEQHLVISEYRRLYIESVQEFTRVAEALTDRLNRLEAVLKHTIDRAERVEGKLAHLYWWRKIKRKLGL